MNEHHTPPSAADRDRPAKVSVLIPAYNACATLEACLLSLTHQRLRRPFSFEVLVVDDGSDDGTGTMVDSFTSRLDLRYAYEPRTPASGRARARNIGLAMATGSLVVTLDADQVVGPDFLAHHLRAHGAATDLLVVGRRCQLGEGKFDLARLARGFSLDALPEVVRGDEREPVFAALSCQLTHMRTAWHYLWTCNASVRPERLAASGGFDERFRGWGLEDAELGYRLVRDGVRMRYSARAAVYHEHRSPVSASMYREWRENLGHFAHKHPDPAVRLQEMFAPAIDPAAPAAEAWVDTAVRFEHAARALESAPQPAPHH
ncbi:MULTISPECIES: glycosyltransferase family 2 protein [Streptomyces]|uniref:glycosyltransferase family 2 protein n=1 Tax=Streptomyces TaxID=1883 RepID=UPI0019643501|nr:MULTISPECIES: glycosyltransferase [Streptomyces]QRX95236.1 glycosyltransferase [Streptomyces noursei]UJB45938.1 glycosyltransferase [Streptomyces sp. A1-5]